MREADRATIVDRCFPSLVLMENAAFAVKEKLHMLFPDLQSSKVLVLCGKGNNGGDGLAVARQLKVQHPQLDLTAVVLADRDSLSPDARANLEMLTAQDCRAAIAPTVDHWRGLLADAADATIVVDAILGTGLSGPARGLPQQVISDVNTAFRNATVVAVDMPSGLGSDSGFLLGDSIRADHTVTFTAPKVSQALPPSCESVGKLTIARIGTADSVLDALPGSRLFLTEAVDSAAYAGPRSLGAHKGSYGHVIAFGGSRSQPGAILMAGTAALRAGAGLVTVATAAGAGGAIISATPELMLEPGRELRDGSLGPQSFDSRVFEAKTVAALGPGLGTSKENLALARQIYLECPLPLVVDADGLRAVLPEGDKPRPAPTVLTPHPGEMAQIARTDTVSIQRDRLGYARRIAAGTGAVVVLKGQRSLIASPDGDVAVNPTGTPGMATAGSGDILTGIIAGLIAQFPDRPVFRTVVAGVYLHGLAGELASNAIGEQGMLATDIGRFLADARRSLCA